MKRYWQEEALYVDTENYFSALLQDISKAKKSVALETYIFNQDHIGKKIIAALRAAAERGVRIRVLMDGIGSDEDGESIVEALQHPLIQAHIFRPLPWRFGSRDTTHTKASWYQRLMNRITRINKRNHRKLCVIDNEIAWVGSFNITDDHFGKSIDGESSESWKDLAVRIRDDNVEKLLQSFEQIWRRIDTGNRINRIRNFISNHSRRMRTEKNRHLIGLLRQARKRIWITNAYFSPSHAFLKALADGVKRGVSVRIIVPNKSDVIFFPALTSTYYADLLKAGVHIYEYEGKILHEKSMLIDGMAIVGSTNLNYRSFLHDLELDVLLNQPKTIHELEARFETDLQQSCEITAPRLQNYPLLLRILGWFSRFFRYVL